jgi:hypothetical protein
LKERYREDPDAAIVTLKAHATLPAGAGGAVTFI